LKELHNVNIFQERKGGKMSINLNWGAWLQGLISAFASGGVTAIAALAVLKTRPDTWTLFVIAGIPAALNFFSYIKDCPPPIGGKLNPGKAAATQKSYTLDDLMKGVKK
jgi:hypothetical protein